ncbi:MAG: hypothetical protein A2080_16395 [Ignavibacteria bacterium GWC2_36_12]|nr:MAG: hypothetical protein A2080_16395 [Ignavibacteria bacterium GWC2_36_12]
MKHLMEKSEENLSYLRDVIFPGIRDRNTILFLGAGASVGTKRFLGQQIIDLYSDKLGIRLTVNNLVDFVDQLSANPDIFDRDDFDTWVTETFSEKLKPTETHSAIVRMNWREIITTNFDLLIERAYDQIVGTRDHLLKIKVIRNWDSYRYYPANDEIKYVKLSGCVSNKDKYPLVFSSKDFHSAGRFYKIVLSSLENLSPQINFLAMGYSFTDPFSKMLLDKFDSYNFRRKKWMISVDPFIQDEQLPFFRDNQIAVIKMTCDEFIGEYVDWENSQDKVFYNLKRIKYSDVEKKIISVPPDLALRLGDNFVQLSDYYKSAYVEPKDFYKGETPNFEIVKKDYDVVKRKLVDEIKDEARRLLNENNALVPILLLTGSYGIGKSTLCYRLIRELLLDMPSKYLGFEIINASKINSIDIGELLSKSRAKNIIIFFNGIDVDSIFKSLLDFRNKLSIEQYTEFRILLLASIRDNILTKYKLNKELLNALEINVDIPFNRDEAAELIEKLSDSGLISYRDAKQKNILVDKVINKFSGDSFITLISLISSSHHANTLIDAYNQLTKDAQKAFLFTSLFYRFHILTPVSLLQKMISKNWEDFRRDILEYDSKNILVQEIIDATGTEPDLYFRTKHPIVSQKLVELLLPNEDKRFDTYQALLKRLNYNTYNAGLVIDLLRAIENSEDLTTKKINKLYDVCGSEFAGDPHFTLHYAINLQHRNNEADLKVAIEKVQYVESVLETRNHFLIHRRAVLNFMMAKLKYQQEIELSDTYIYINEARALFEIKTVLDPFSAYSYVDYIKLEVWCYEKIVLDNENRIQQYVKIEELFDKAEKSVFENSHWIANMRADFIKNVKNKFAKSDGEYLSFLDEIYQKESLRPYAIILKYYYYESVQENNKLEVLIRELEEYDYLNDVERLLFKHYGRNLFVTDNRTKLFQLIQGNKDIEQQDPIRFHYYTYIAEAYNKNFQYSKEHIYTLKNKFYYLNPKLCETWIDNETREPRIFDAVITESRNHKIRVRVIDLQQEFNLRKSNYDMFDLSISSHHQVTLHFFLTGIRAEIIT